MRKINVGTLILIILTVSAFAYFNTGIRRDAETIQNEFEQKIRTEMVLADVVRLLQEDGRVAEINDHGGFYDSEVRSLIGKKSIRAHLGSYRMLFFTDVVLFVGFDSNDKIERVRVQKFVDAP